MITRNVMLDHPAWEVAPNGSAVRVVRHGQGPSISVLFSGMPSPERVFTQSFHICGDDLPPVVDVVDADTLVGPAEIVEPLRAAGSVARWRNPDLWDALATSIIRQAAPSVQARHLYRRFSFTCGQAVVSEFGELSLFPSPRAVLELSRSTYQTLGLASKQERLQTAAKAYLDSRERWATLAPAALVHAVLQVPGVGEWTAQATVADLTNDFSLYPIGDKAVRTWARCLAPSLPWPTTRHEFTAFWRATAGNQVSEWTTATLAWGLRKPSTAADTQRRPLAQLPEPAFPASSTQSTSLASLSPPCRSPDHHTLPPH